MWVQIKRVGRYFNEGPLSQQGWGKIKVARRNIARNGHKSTKKQRDDSFRVRVHRQQLLRLRFNLDLDEDAVYPSHPKKFPRKYISAFSCTNEQQPLDLRWQSTHRLAIRKCFYFYWEVGTSFPLAV